MPNSYHSKAVAHPERLPVVGALWDVHVLAVHGDHIGRHLAHDTPEIDRMYELSTLELSTDRDMNSGIARSATGIIGMGSLVDNQ